MFLIIETDVLWVFISGIKKGKIQTEDFQERYDAAILRACFPTLMAPLQPSKSCPGHCSLLSRRTQGDRRHQKRSGSLCSVQVFWKQSGAMAGAAAGGAEI